MTGEASPEASDYKEIDAGGGPDWLADLSDELVEAGAELKSRTPENAPRLRSLKSGESFS